MGARYYAGSKARFLSEDPVFLSVGSPELKQKTGAAETQVTPPLSDVRFGALEGRVINEEGTAIWMNVKAYLDGQVRGNASSQETMGGFYQFARLEPGVYEIRIERPYPDANAYQPHLPSIALIA